MIELLRALCDAPGISGFEDQVAAIVRADLGETCDEVRTDRLGNVIGVRHADRAGDCEPLKVMIAAHMDEIGFLVRHIDPEGYIRFMPIGGFDPRTLVAQRIVIHGRRAVKGVIAPQPNWIVKDKDRERTLALDELVIDLGLDRDQVTAAVQVGDPISLAQPFEVLNEHVVIGRNFDDRVGVYAMLQAMRRLKGCQAEVYAVATVQEEVGLRGVPTAAYAIEPDIGIAIDGSLASDVPYARAQDRHCTMGAGTGIYVIDSRTISDRMLVQSLVQIAQENAIPYQLNLGGGTDASVIQRHRTGARVCTIGPPTRYMHSTAQMCSTADIESTIQLLVAFLERAHGAE